MDKKKADVVVAAVEWKLSREAGKMCKLVVAGKCAPWNLAVEFDDPDDGKPTLGAVDRATDEQPHFFYQLPAEPSRERKLVDMDEKMKRAVADALLADGFYVLAPVELKCSCVEQLVLEKTVVEAIAKA